MTLDVERAQVEATKQKYHEKLRSQTARRKVTIDLDKMLEKKKV
jgi:hypothetical protein